MAAQVVEVLVGRGVKVVAQGMAPLVPLVPPVTAATMELGVAAHGVNMAAVVMEVDLEAVPAASVMVQEVVMQSLAGPL